jgi:uncharacterized membrane protein
VLGTFVATFVYCVLVLRTVRGVDGEQFVPNMAVTAGVLLALASLGVLIYFIHHMSVLIQAPTVIAMVGAELDATVDRLFPERAGDGVERADVEPPGAVRDSGAGDAICASSTGYVEALDVEALVDVAARNDVVIRVTRRPGHFVAEGAEVLEVVPAGRLDAGSRRRLARAVYVARRRSPSQDVEFAVEQLVEIALRALSPSSNDPFTAVACIERLGAALARLGRRRIPSPYRVDGEGTLRVVAYPVTYAGVVNAAFDQIRQSARSHVAVTIRMLEVIADVARQRVDRRMAEALFAQAVMIERGSRNADLDPSDREDVARRHAAVREALARVAPARSLGVAR